MLNDKNFKIGDLVNKDLIINKEMPESKRDKLWKECISEARILIGKYSEIRIRVVELALKCCVIHYGGRASQERYTVKQFAREIGIAPGTLFEWIRLRSLYLSLPEKEKENCTFKDLTFLSKTVTGLNRKDKDFKKNLATKFKELKSKHPSTVKMEKYLKVMKTVKFNDFKSKNA